MMFYKFYKATSLEAPKKKKIINHNYIWNKLILIGEKKKTDIICGLKRKLVKIYQLYYYKNILNYFVYSIAHLNK